MILACQNISKSFGTDEIIKNASFHIEENEKAAIVGINGAGKSTLLKIIMQEIDADEGTVTVAKRKDDRLSGTASGTGFGQNDLRGSAFRQTAGDRDGKTPAGDGRCHEWL